MKRVKNFEEHYLVSKDGEVFSIRKNRFLNKKLQHGYYKVDLYKKNVRKRKFIHRIVAESFLNNPQKLPVVNHIDGDKLNNNISNLEWCTRSWNTKHAYKNGLIPSGVDHPKSKLTKKEVLTIRKKYVPYNYTIRMLSEEFDISTSQVLRIIKNEHWKYT